MNVYLPNNFISINKVYFNSSFIYVFSANLFSELKLVTFMAKFRALLSSFAPRLFSS